MYQRTRTLIHRTKLEGIASSAVRVIAEATAQLNTAKHEPNPEDDPFGDLSFLLCFLNVSSHFLLVFLVYCPILY